MGTLVDTSIWRRFFAGKGPAAERERLRALLDGDEVVLTHSVVIGELVLGGLSARQEGLMRRLPFAPSVADDEVLLFVKHHELMRKGIGWADAHLLASVHLASATLWSADEKLAQVAAALHVAFQA